MIFEKETKERFVAMLKARQIIVVQSDKGRNYKTYRYKFIGADSQGRWDFTPLVAEYSGYPSNVNSTVMYLSVRSNNAAAVIADTLVALKHEAGQELGNPSHQNWYSLYEEVRSLLCTFYI